MCRKLEDCLLTRTGFRVFLVTALLVLVAVIGMYSYKVIYEDEEVSKVERRQVENHKILLWTPLHGSWSEWWTSSYLGPTDAVRAANCPHISSCSFSTDRNTLNTSSLVIFSYGDLQLTDLPPKYLLTQRDDPAVKQNNSISSAPHQHQNYKVRFRKLFRDILKGASHSSDSLQKELTDFSSDLSHFQYGEVRSRRHERGKEGHRARRRAFQYDSRLVATIIDDCQTDSNREGYIESMSEHVNIHIYGSCGAPCPGDSPQECLQYLARFYKFLLVFEPFLCQHFVSDLVWSVLKTNLVPVVFGGVNYAKLLPVGSYIDALNQSPKNLAHFLRYLDKNDELYKNYYKWKDDYYVEDQSWSCKLCSSLNSPSQLVFPPSQVELPDDMCTSWPELRFGLTNRKP